ncbi:MAG: FecR domain-containing protein [Chthoniobacterales bacterium]
MVKLVQLQTGTGPARPVTAPEEVPLGTSVVTGAAARSELAVGDGAVVRLAAKTRVMPLVEARLQLDDGALLFQARKGGGSPTIVSAGLNVVTSGSTGIVDRSGQAYAKILVLEGTARVYLRGIGESVLVEAGQMLITRPGAKTLPEAVNFDIEKLYRTSVFTRRDLPPLASASAIEKAIARQKRDPDFTRTNLVIFGRGTLVNLVQPSPAPAASPRRMPPAQTPPTPRR